MKKLLLLLGMAILLLGLAQQFDGQETVPTHRKVRPGSKSANERQPDMSQARFFSRQSPDRWTTDHTLFYQQRMTNLMGQQDLRVNTAPTGGAFMQQELSAGVDTAWVRHYASGLIPRYHEAAAIAVDSSGNIYVTGSSAGFPSNSDYLTIKYDSSGAQLWMARYNGPGNADDEATALAVDASGNVYVTGRSRSLSSGLSIYDYATVKYNPAGVMQWVAHYNGPGNAADEATALAVDASGNVYVTGASVGLGTDKDYATVKYNSAGIEQWVARYNGPGNADDGAIALAVDASGNVYVTGSSGGSGTSSDYATIKYSAAGFEQWVARYNGPGNDYDRATALAVDAFGNVYVTGASASSNSYPYNDDYATVKYNSDGVEQWVARYDGSGNSEDYANALAVDASGSVYVTGASGGYYATVKYNSAGMQQWDARYTGKGDDKATAIAVDPSGSVYVTGESASSGGSFDRRDYVTIKYNSAGIKQWAVRYNGPGNYNDYAIALVMDGSGNVYVTGSSASKKYSSYYDYATVKYNSSGVEQWVIRYNDLENSCDEATALAVDAASNVYVTGRSEGSGTGRDFATVKYNSAGVEQWVARYNGPGNSGDGASALAVDAFGNVYVTGISADSIISPHNYDYATVKYNSDGVEQWIARYNGPGNADDEARALAVDAFGNVYVTGMINYPYPDYATVKYNSAGVEQWVARYNGPGNSYGEATALAVDASGNVYVTGRSGGSYTWNCDYATVKYNSAGIEQWVARYNGPKNDWDGAAALAIDAFGNVYVAGYSGSYLKHDYATIKYSAAGTEQWVARYNGPGNADDEANALAVDASGNVYVTGSSDWDYATIKYNSSGTEQWVARYNTPMNVEWESMDFARVLAIDASGNVYVTGTSGTVKYNSEGVEQWVAGSDVWSVTTSLAVDASANVYVSSSSQGDGWSVYTTIKYIQTPVSVEKEEPSTPICYWLSQNYPNPFNPSTTIEFALPKSAFVTLKVYNLLGEEVATLVAEQRTAGIHKFNWDARGLASGMYLYRLEVGSFIQTRKLIVLR